MGAKVSHELTTVTAALINNPLYADVRGVVARKHLKKVFPSMLRAVDGRDTSTYPLQFGCLSGDDAVSYRRLKHPIPVDAYSVALHYPYFQLVPETLSIPLSSTTDFSLLKYAFGSQLKPNVSQSATSQQKSVQVASLVHRAEQYVEGVRRSSPPRQEPHPSSPSSKAPTRAPPPVTADDVTINRFLQHTAVDNLNVNLPLPVPSRRQKKKKKGVHLPIRFPSSLLLQFISFLFLSPFKLNLFTIVY
jgi:hypothetical protein